MSSVINRVSDRLLEAAKRKASDFAERSMPPTLPATAGRLVTDALRQRSSDLSGVTAPAGPGMLSPDMALGAPAPFLGGLSLGEAERLMREASGVALAWKSLWHVAVRERTFPPEAPAGVSRLLNLLGVDVTLGPATISGDAHNVGAAVVDYVNGTERVEVTFTTYDDERGSIERWFAGKCDQVAHESGTFGVPSDYLLMMTLTQMDVTGARPASERMTHKLWLRPAGYELDLSRRAHELKELSLRFTQFDTMIKAA